MASPIWQSVKLMSLGFLDPIWQVWFINAIIYLPVCLSKVEWNWLIGGGIFKRVWRTAFCLCKRTYLGHLTKRLKSRLGWICWPIWKLRGRATKRGFLTLLTSGFLTAKGAAATFFPFFLDCKLKIRNLLWRHFWGSLEWLFAYLFLNHDVEMLKKFDDYLTLGKLDTAAQVFSFLEKEEAQLTLLW